jgi:hypothetical protein
MRNISEIHSLKNSRGKFNNSINCHKEPKTKLPGVSVEEFNNFDDQKDATSLSIGYN